MPCALVAEREEPPPAVRGGVTNVHALKLLLHLHDELTSARLLPPAHPAPAGFASLNASSVAQLKKALPSLEAAVGDPASLQDFYTFAFKFCLTVGGWVGGWVGRWVGGSRASGEPGAGCAACSLACKRAGRPLRQGRPGAHGGLWRRQLLGEREELGPAACGVCPAAPLPAATPLPLSSLPCLAGRLLSSIARLPARPPAGARAAGAGPEDHRHRGRGADAGAGAAGRGAHRRAGGLPAAAERLQEDLVRPVAGLLQVGGVSPGRWRRGPARPVRQGAGMRTSSWAEPCWAWRWPAAARHARKACGTSRLPRSAIAGCSMRPTASRPPSGLPASPTGSCGGCTRT